LHLHSPRGLVREMPDGRDDTPGRCPDSLTRLGRRRLGVMRCNGGTTRTRTRTRTCRVTRRRRSFRGPEDPPGHLMEKVLWHMNRICVGGMYLHKNLTSRLEASRNVPKSDVTFDPST